MNTALYIAVWLLFIFLIIEGGRRALELTFKWINFIQGALLFVAGIAGFIGVIQAAHVLG